MIYCTYPTYPRIQENTEGGYARFSLNLFHGSAFDYLRNDIFDARNYFDAPPLSKPPLRQNDFGGTLGGPIIKNKTFFFFSYEGLRLRLPQTDSNQFYTASARA